MKRTLLLCAIVPWLLSSVGGFMVSFPHNKNARRLVAEPIGSRWQGLRHTTSPKWSFQKVKKGEDAEESGKKPKKLLLRLKSWFRRIRRREKEQEDRTSSPSLVDDTTMRTTTTTTVKVSDGTSPVTPVGPRWAIAAKDVNFTGVWKPIVTPAFKQEYDDYLRNCGENKFLRNFYKSVVGLVKEVIYHDGNHLTIAGTTPVGKWERVLISSGTDLMHDTFDIINVTVVDPDGDHVDIEACWEDDGHTHVSWMRGKPRVHGGVFETRRYMMPSEEGPNYLICESLFHPCKDSSSSRFQEASVKWKFELVNG